MSLVAAPLALDDEFRRAFPELALDWTPAAVDTPRLLALNVPLASQLGLDPERLGSPDGVAVLAGNAVATGAVPVAQAYAGHQFGGYSPRLGDGRAVLLGELVDRHGERRDLALKGSGRTPFARGGDGKAAVGPMLREYVIGEAMHALGIPTTRALAVVATGELIVREGMLPGAVLTRVAASHLRVGTFEYAVRLGQPGLVERLAQYALERHYPDAAARTDAGLAVLESVVEAQAALVARWMLVGFIHGVMNTDNMTISGETIDYGPCAFLDRYDPATVYSSIDHTGRYAYGNQPRIAQWNLTRLAETLLPTIDADVDAAVDAAVAAATAVLGGFPERFRQHWLTGMRAKLALPGERFDDAEFVDATLALLHANRVDYTGFFRALSAAITDPETLRPMVSDVAALDAWTARWVARRTDDRRPAAEVAAALDAVNPVYIPRNHLVEEALAGATAGDLVPFESLVAAVSSPFAERAIDTRYAEPAPASFTESYQTFCGT